MGTEIVKLLTKIQRAYDDIDAFVATLTEAQLTDLKDGGGWSVKDHLIHMAVWDDGLDALLNREDTSERMGIAGIEIKPRTDDAINDVIFHQHKDKTLDEVKVIRQRIHDRLVATISAMSDEDLNRPYKDFNAKSNSNQPILGSILGNTSGHYRKHLPWIKAIIGKA